MSSWEYSILPWIYEDIWLWLEDIKASFWTAEVLLTSTHSRDLTLIRRVASSFLEILRVLLPPLDWLLTELDKVNITKYTRIQLQSLKEVSPGTWVNVKFFEELMNRTREAWGPNPPCVICGEESEFCILPRPLQPETWIEDLYRQHIFSMLPVMPCFCNKHSDEEISEWFKKRGIDLKVEIKRDKE